MKKTLTAEEREKRRATRAWHDEAKAAARRVDPDIKSWGGPIHRGVVRHKCSAWRGPDKTYPLSMVPVGTLTYRVDNGRLRLAVCPLCKKAWVRFWGGKWFRHEEPGVFQKEEGGRWSEAKQLA